MRYAIITFAIVMMAASLSSFGNKHVGALPLQLIKRAVDITQCFGEHLLEHHTQSTLNQPFGRLVTKQAFDDNCKALFLPGGIKAVHGIKLTALDFDFTDPDPLKITLSSPEMLVDVIPGLPGLITSTRQDVILVDNGVEIAKFSTPWADGVMDGNVLKTTVGRTTVNVIDDKREKFSAFISALTINPSHTFILKGEVHVKMNIALTSTPGVLAVSGPFGSFTKAAKKIGDLVPSKIVTITGIYFESEVTLTGFANFPDIEFVELLEKTENADGGFTIKSKVNIKNVSQLSVKMGNVQFNTFDAESSEPIGITVLEQLTLARGDNFITAVSTSTSATKNPHEIYTRVTENGETFRLEGSLESSMNDPILAKGISVVRASVKIP
ncbi:hypothetical protein K457DRAFT_21928, partial [Linnemannia elongata AG-77]